MTIPRNREIAGTTTILSNGAVNTGRRPSQLTAGLLFLAKTW
jgi:hypothetical protein